MRRPSKAELELWYTKLKESGFVDIERGKDMNMYPATTMPSGHQTMIEATYATPDDPDDDQEVTAQHETTSLVNHDRAIYWRRLLHKAHKIKQPNPHKQFIIDWCESGHLIQTARDYGYTRAVARTIAAKFLESAGVDNFQTRTEGQEQVQVSPGRKLTKFEIRELQTQGKFTPPNKIKDSSDD